MRTLRLAFVCCVLLGVVSCKESRYKEAIIGKWQLTDGPPGVVLEFGRDGKASMAGVDGTYRLDGSDNVTITTNKAIAGHTRFTSKVSISGDQMTLTDPDGKVTHYKKL